MSFIIYSAPSTPPYLCCMFCGNFCKARKNIPVFEMIPRGYSISYFSLFLIFTLSRATQVNILHTLYLLLHTYFCEYLLNFEKIYFCALLKLHFSPNLSLLMRTSQFLKLVPQLFHLAILLLTTFCTKFLSRYLISRLR